jgi:hypothetical protein
MCDQPEAHMLVIPTPSDCERKSKPPSGSKLTRWALFFYSSTFRVNALISAFRFSYFILASLCCALLLSRSRSVQENTTVAFKIWSLLYERLSGQ